VVNLIQSEDIESLVKCHDVEELRRNDVFEHPMRSSHLLIIFLFFLLNVALLEMTNQYHVEKY
jgi:hypothetical protein